ncbi:MAG: B12-binding domain-containing radical SAM protein [Myxococcota bacterium]
MKILLIKPKMHPDNIQPPLGLGYLASNILRSGNSVKIFDLELLKINSYQIDKILKQEEPDIVGIQCYTYGIRIVKEYLRAVKRYRESIITVLGGPQATSAPEETLQYMSPYVDYIICGEAEEEFVKFIKSIESGNDSAEKIIRAGLIEDLNRLPLPLWEQIDPNKYPPAPHGAFFRKLPVAPIIASRGCPYNCYFCSATHISGSKVRYRSVENIIEEIEYIVKHFGVKEIHFVDDNFTFNRNFVIDFCDKIMSKNIKLSFACPNGVRIDTIDRELLLMMKKAGFYSLALGIESGSPQILEKINKNIQIEKVKKTVNLIREMDMFTIGFFIIGLPFETTEDIEKTIEFACSLDLTLANFMLYHPLPGTVLFEKMRGEGLNKLIDYDAVSFSHSAYSHNGIGKYQLKSLQVKAFMHFYGRPKYFLQTLKFVRSLNHLVHILKRINRWLISSWFRICMYCC